MPLPYGHRQMASLDLKIDPIEYFGMLDVDAKIYILPILWWRAATKSANQSFCRNLWPSTSRRQLSFAIAGGAEGTPSNGFSNYSSLGYYAMSGTLGRRDTTQLTGLDERRRLGESKWQHWHLNYYAIDVPAGKPVWCSRSTVRMVMPIYSHS